jgi:DNA helicase-2/ATP-dependent DNA helicase PcrA
LARFLGLVADHTRFARDHKPSELLVKALTDIGYTTYVQGLGEEQARLTFSFLNQFHARVRRWEASERDPRLKDFMAAMAYELESGEAGDVAVDVEAGPEVVPVMTVHAAKGLEFAYVFVVGLVERRFPTSERREPIAVPDALVRETVPVGDTHLEEERRLFYVAMTRAKRGVFLTSAEDYGGARAKRLSPFLRELGLPLASPRTRPGGEAFATPPAVREPATETLRPYIPAEFSFTSLKAYEVCPFQYRYAHVLRVPVWGRHTFSFGSSVHLTL